jgi:glycosyltransferase involved in cell wall biosynthesis
MSDTAREHIAIIGPKGIPNDFSGSGGIEAYVENQIDKLLLQGTRVTCYVHRWSSQKHLTNLSGVTLINIPTINSISFDTLSYSFLASIHAALGDANVVWYHGIGPSFFTFIPKLFKKRVYITIHAHDWKRKKWNWATRAFLYACERVAVYSADRLYVVSVGLYDYYKNRFHKAAVIDKYIIGKHVRVPAGLITRKYHLNKQSYVLYLGRFVPEKRIEWLIRAGNMFPDVRFVISGEGGFSPAYDRSLKQMANSKNIIFTGYVTGKEKAELLSNCRAFVLPSTLEGYPVCVAEALGYQRPCLVGDFLKPEYPRHIKQLYYFKTDDFGDFVNKITSLVKTPVSP